MITQLTLFTRDADGGAVVAESWAPGENLATEEAGIAYAKGVIRHFNNTLREGEHARVLVEVEMVFTDGWGVHEWEKSNLITIIDGRFNSHDTYRCHNCKITGKRFGLGSTIVRDKQYNKPKYDLCDKVKE